MSDESVRTREIRYWIDRMRDGDDSAREQLLHVACDRLEQLSRRLLSRFARVRRWEETADVRQSASLRLYRTLKEITPESPQEFYRLAALNIRRELLDLAKKHYGPLGQGAHHETWSEDSGAANAAPALRSAPAREDVGNIVDWGEFHEQVQLLPDDEREVFDLLWYGGLGQSEAARILDVSERTVKRRWQSARIRLYDSLHGELPEP
ncbi:RNA polymerase sigma factor [Planctomycetes bacterium Pan216]|uniref:RNA polymerase sigma factor n=1 Tax=Kolteria novifilia TaxID=2527975 RepID=A0A518B7P2_9BACT|nr:RNA polymerase sigma factor [Planctomycetes bacterium Pan216]